MFLARNLEVMTRSGMQVLDSLEIIKRQTKSKPFNAMIDQLIVDIKNGHFLSSGLERYHNIFGDFFINLIRVGESSGTLSENLKYLADELKKKDELNKKIVGAMAYPVILIIATLSITAILAFFIFPKILPVLTSLHVPLPLMTRGFIVVSQFLFNYGIYLFSGLAVFLIAFFIMLRVRAFKFLWHRVILILPFVKIMSQNINMVNFARTLGLLLKSGVKIIEALQICADTLNNLVYKDEISRMSEGVRRGDTLSKYLNQDSKLFPPIFSEMILVGENTGKLDESLLFLANYYESELDESTRNMSNVLEPTLLLLMGVIVVIVAMAIITPIYKITQNLGR
jgi:type II secretory pathway component PulF